MDLFKITIGSTFEEATPPQKQVADVTLLKFIKTGLTAIARQANDTKKMTLHNKYKKTIMEKKTDQRPICKHKYILQGTTKINHDQCFANFNPPLAIEQEAMSYQPCNNS